MSRYLSESVKKLVRERANLCCEYCRQPESNSFIKFQFDHIIAIRHGGKSVLENLAFCCMICNRLKGTDLATYLLDEEKLIRLFHPRKHIWSAHFEVSEGVIYPKTDIGEATIKLLDFNEINRILERKNFMDTAWLS